VTLLALTFINNSSEISSILITYVRYLRFEVFTMKELKSCWESRRLNAELMVAKTFVFSSTLKRLVFRKYFVCRRVHNFLRLFNAIAKLHFGDLMSELNFFCTLLWNGLCCLMSAEKHLYCFTGRNLLINSRVTGKDKLRQNSEPFSFLD
jgi:hypothetical protein